MKEKNKSKRKYINKYMKKINQFLKNNEPLSDFISKIFLTIITISIAINANEIAKKQNDIDEINIMPNIVISYEGEKSKANEKIKIINDGGPVYNLKTEIYTFLNVMCTTTNIDGDYFLNSRIPIIMHYKIDTGNQKGLLLFYGERGHLNFKQMEEIIKEKLNETLNGQICSIDLISTSYLKITYEDKLHHSTTKYFIGEYIIEEEKILKFMQEYISPIEVEDENLDELICTKVLDEYTKRN